MNLKSRDSVGAKRAFEGINSESRIAWGAKRPFGGILRGGRHGGTKRVLGRMDTQSRKGRGSKRGVGGKRQEKMWILGSPERVSSLGRNAGGATSGPWDGGQEREQSFLMVRRDSSLLGSFCTSSHTTQQFT